MAATNDQWKTLELSWAGGTTNVEPAGWQNVGFNDAGWSAAYIPTDPYPTWVDIAGADWLSSTGRAAGHLTSEIWIARHEFQLAGAPDGDGTLTWNVDNYASIWVNGQQIVTTGGNWTSVFTTVVPAAMLRTGANAIGVKVFQDANTNTWAVNPTFFQAILSVPVASGPPIEQSYGTGSGAHGPSTTHKVKDPIDTATGNFVTQATDLALPGRGLPFAFARTYNSLDTAVGPLGPGWRHGYRAGLILEAGGTARFIAEDGAQYLFAPDGAGGFVRPAGATSSLTPLAGGGFELVRRDGLRYRFDPAGRLTSLLDRNGNSLGFSYSAANLTAISDTVGRVIVLGYDASSRLTSLTDPTGRTVGYGYDPAGRLASVTDVRGGTTAYTYDAGGRLATITDQNLHVLATNSYGADGRVTEQLDARSQRGTFTWDPATGTSTYTDARGGRWLDVYTSNKLVRQVDPVGNTMTYTYDAAFNRTSVTDPRGNTTTMTYDARGNLLTTTAPVPLGYVETFTYNAANDLLTAKNRRGNTMTNTYDAGGNLTKATAPDSTFSTFTYGPGGLVLSSTDPRARTTTYGYDAQANLTGTTTPLGNLTTMTYDGAGRMLTIVDPRGNITGANAALYTTTLTYDAADHVLSATDPLGNVTTTTYDPAGNRTSVKDAKNRTTTYAYDPANHLTSVTDPAGKVTAYGYDPTGNLISRTDANNHVTGYTYDLVGRLTATTDPAGRAWTLTYDPTGNIATRRDAKANTTTFGYDAINRLTAITYAASSTAPVTYAYDGNGNRTTMTDGAGTETYVYDALDRLTRVTRGADVFSYAFDPGSNMTSRTYPDGTLTTYTYDVDGRLASAASAGTSTSYTYDPAGNPLTTATPDGFTARNTYDRAGRLLEVAHTSSAGILSRATYSLDPVGNRTTMTTTRGVMLYSYDALDRLTQVCYGACPGGGGGGDGASAAATPAAACLACVSANNVVVPPVNDPPAPTDTFTSWTYDPVGNRLTEGNYLGTRTYAYDLADRLTGTTGPGTAAPTTYAYDANGNQTGAGTTTSAYDLADRLVSTTVGSTTETYTWSGDGLRRSAATGSQAVKTVRFLVDRTLGEGSVAIERDGADKTLRRYVYGLDLLSQTSLTKGPFWYHHDGLGSVTDITSSTGVSLAWTEYQPFGLVRAAASTSQAPLNPFRFTGEYRDPTTGLDHLRARQYDPGTGRFTATDPVSPGVGDPYVSAYAYVNGNPVRYTDPSGRCFQLLVGGLAAALVTGGTSAVAGGALTVGCAVVFGAITVVAGAAAWVGGSAAGKALGDLSRGDPTHREWTPPIPDQRASTPLIVQLEPSELGWGTPGGGSQLPNPCRAMHLTWRQCAALGFFGTVGGGVLYFDHENQEGIHADRPHKPPKP